MDTNKATSRVCKEEVDLTMSSNSTLAYATITRLDGVPMEPVKIPIHWPKDESQLLNSESNEYYTRVVESNTLDRLLKEVDSGTLIKYQEVKPFKCPLCRKSFFRYAPLKKHTNDIHLNILKNNLADGRSSDTCPFSKCRLVLKNNIAMQKHIKCHRDNTYKSYRCPIMGCKKRFKFKSKADEHIENHKAFQNLKDAKSSLQGSPK